MKFKIPFSFTNIEVLKRRKRSFIKTRKKAFASLDENLKNSDIGIAKDIYLSLCVKTLLITFPIFLVVFFTAFYFLKADYFYIFAPLAALVFSGFIFISQLNYPKIYVMRKARGLEKNLISALQDILIQLNSGVPIFDILVNISRAGYGEVSEEFKKIVREINSGTPQIAAIDARGKKSASEYFKRVLWQISNGMRAGSDLSIVIADSIDNLSKEQVIQIQGYGSKLNPLIVFYMLIGIILPALSITFITVIASIIGMSRNLIILFFSGMFVFAIFVQIMFLGLVRSRRPSLL